MSSKDETPKNLRGLPRSSLRNNPHYAITGRSPKKDSWEQDSESREFDERSKQYADTRLICKRCGVLFEPTHNYRGTYPTCLSCRHTNLPHHSEINAYIMDKDGRIVR